MLKTIFPIFFSMYCFVLTGQVTDSLSTQIDTSKVAQIDSIEVKKEKGKFFKKILDKTYPNPLRASAMSLVLPGTGQIYNKRWWKAPIIYGALGVTGYFIVDNTRSYREFREAYLFRVDGDPTTIDQFPNASESTLLSIRNGFDKRRQQSYVGFFAVWLLNSIDAFVDAHLISFDIEEDLSLIMEPTTGYENNAASIGIKFSLKSKKDKLYCFYFE